MVSKSEVIANSCNLAYDYFEKNMSPMNLLLESGYSEHCESISIEDIQGYISLHPDVAKYWFSYSENKRTSSGWYISADSKQGQFRVGYLHPDESKREFNEYTEYLSAVADYIKKELDSMASNQKRS